MLPPVEDIAQAIAFAVAATYKEFDKAPSSGPGLEDCRFSLYLALMGHLQKGQMRVAQVKDVDPKGPQPVVYLDDNVVFVLGDHMFDEAGLVSREALLARSEAFSQRPTGPNTQLVLEAPLPSMLDEHVKPELVAAYRKFLVLGFEAIELQRSTPQVQVSSQRPRL